MRTSLYFTHDPQTRESTKGKIMWPFSRRKQQAPPVYSDTYLYLMRSEGLSKIGISDNPERRRRQVQAASGRDVAIVQTWRAERPREIEAALHRHFGTQRAHGEWFRLSPEDLWAIHAVLGGK